ncbi:MAG: prepilin peptidase [Myxococcaceae bacterium]|nr:prepilin peptidase [Myxococcaceae bacterium]
MPAPELVLWPLIGVAAVVAAVIDLKRGGVPSWLAWATLGLALLVRLVLEGPGDVEKGVVSGALGAIACAFPFALLALSGPRVGWSDVKLLAAMGAGFGIPRALAAVMLISVVGAGAAVFFVLKRRSQSASLPVTESKAAPRAAIDSARSIPYGVPIAVGVLWAMVWAGPAVPELGAAEVEVELVDGGAAEETVEQPELE